MILQVKDDFLINCTVNERGISTSFYNDDVYLVVPSCCLNKGKAECCGALAVLLELDYLPSSTWHHRTVTLNCTFYLIINWFRSCSISSLICFSSSALLLCNCNWPASRPQMISFCPWVQQIVWGILVAPLIIELLTSFLKLTLLQSSTGQEQKQFLQALVIVDEVSEQPSCGGSLQTAGQAQQQSYCELQIGNHCHVCPQQGKYKNVVVAASPQMLFEAMILNYGPEALAQCKQCMPQVMKCTLKKCFIHAVILFYKPSHQPSTQPDRNRLNVIEVNTFLF